MKIKKTKIYINEEKQLKEMINFEQTGNLISIQIYFNKAKINYSIDEIKPILIVAGQPKSVFFEIFFKSIRKKIKSPIIIISSLKLLISEMKRFNLKKN